VTNTPTGINPDAVTKWMVDNAPGISLPLSFDLITGGASNLTFSVTAHDGERFVLRRPPTGHVLSSAHDMGREFRIISALADTAVPVAPVIGMCSDDSVNGAPFYVMRFVDGLIVFDHADGEAVAPELRPVMTNSLVDTLADLHSIDPASVGLDDLGRHEDYCARQLRRWKRQVDEGSDRSIPLVDELHGRLTEGMPTQQGYGIVHGDYRLDNCMMGHDGQVAAVLDWELCTLGDVLADLGGLIMWWGDDPDVAGRLSDVPTRVEGFGTADEVLARYAARSERDISDLPWYVAFQHWRLACITEGVRVRYAAGAMGDQEGRGDEIAIAVDFLLEQGRKHLNEM